MKFKLFVFHAEDKSNIDIKYHCDNVSITGKIGGIDTIELGKNNLLRLKIEPEAEGGKKGNKGSGGPPPGPEGGRGGRKGDRRRADNRDGSRRGWGYWRDWTRANPDQWDGWQGR